MLRAFKADLHIHTCLSPCGDLLMSPKKITARALEENIDIIAVTDHNSAKNIEAALKAAGERLMVLPGMEVCTKEEAHVLAIFENLNSVIVFQQMIYTHLAGENNPDAFGDQIIVSENDEVERYEKKLLIGATDLPIEQVVSAIHRLGGLAVASHIDRESFSVIGQLGFIPENVEFDALEISSLTKDADAHKRFWMYDRHQFIRNSDAHFLNEIGRNVTRYSMENPSFVELAKAFRRKDGRNVLNEL